MVSTSDSTGALVLRESGLDCSLLPKQKLLKEPFGSLVLLGLVEVLDVRSTDDLRWVDPVVTGVEVAGVL